MTHPLAAVRSAVQPAPASPTASALLALGIGAGLAGAVEAASGSALAGAAAFLFGQMLVGLGLVRAADGAWRLQDPRLVFMVVYGLYGISAALAALAEGSEPPGLAAATFLYGTGLFGFNAVQAIRATPWEDVPRERFRRYPASMVNYGVLVSVVLFVFAYAASRGVTFAATIDRRQAGLLYTQLWVVTIFVTNGVMMYMVAAWDNMSRPGRLLVGASIACFVLLQVTLGNRRDYLFLALFALARAATRRRAVVGVRSGLLVGTGFLLFVLLGVIRQVLIDPRLALQSPLTLVLRANEFVYPIQTLVFYVNAGMPLRLGATYVSWPSLFVPRALWPGKPDSLGLQFLLDAFGTKEYQGFAYTPVTEAFVNFDWVGPLIALSVFALLLDWVVRGARAHPARYLIMYALLVDFNRGEIGAIGYAFTFIGAGFLVQHRLALLTAPRLTAAPALPPRPTSAPARA